MRTKTILIITDNTEDQINGVVTTYKNIEAIAFLEGYCFSYINPGRFKHFSCPGYSEIKISFPWQIGKEIEKISPDYIHIATEGPIGLAARQYLDRNNYFYNTAYHTRFPEGIRKLFGIPEAITWSLVRWFHNHSGKVLTTTDSMVKELKENGFDGEIISWTRGVDRTIFKPNTTISLPTHKLVCVSRVSKEKNLEDFFRLDFPEYKKIMVGDGPMREEYQETYPDVEFVGFKTGHELAQYYQQADVFVFPSRWETFGIVMIEAMACGTPVAAYPCQGPLDVVEHGITGYLDNDLSVAVNKSLMLNRKKVIEGSAKWSWQEAWNIFKNNLIPAKL
jgi:glycosyltransferase involved in cell wall biosynthesis